MKGYDRQGRGGHPTGCQPEGTHTLSLLSGTSRSEAFGLGRQELEELLDALDRREEAQYGAVRREPRYPYRHYDVKLHIIEPSGTQRTIRVITRNLSNHGLAFVHAGFLYPGTRCTADLITADNAWQRVGGVVVRCTLISGKLHDLGVRFDEPIDASRFVAFTLSARILLVEDSPTIARMTRHVLEKVGAQTEVVSSGDEAIERATSEPFDLILMDLEMPERDGLATTQELRKRGLRVPIIAYTNLEGADVRQRCLEAGCDEYLCRPAPRHVLLQTLRRFLGDGAPIYSSYADDEEMHDLIVAFVKELPDMLERCQQAVRDQDADGLLHIVREIKGAAGGHGFDPLARAAREVEQFMTSEGFAAGGEFPGELLRLVDALVQTGRRVRASRND